MMNTFNHTLAHGHLSFCYTNRGEFDERELHTYHELLFCVNGSAFMLTDRSRQRIEKGTLVIIPREHYHFVQCEEGVPFERLRIAFDDTDAPAVIAGFTRDIRVIGAPAANLLFLTEEICKAVAGKDTPENTLKAYGAFLMLVGEISTQQPHAAALGKRSGEHLIAKCIAYIEGHIFEKLTVSEVASALYVSPSTLSHAFKKELGIPFHRYITEKRLIAAHKRIAQGESPTQVYADYGHSDYSSFYRAYLKMFGHPPSDGNR